MPVGLVVLPVAEPVLLCLQIHGGEIEGTIVRDEALEALVVVACEVVDAEASKRCTYGCKSVFINEGQILSSIVDGREVVVHALSAPVTRDFLKPLLSEAWQTTTVRSHDNITVGSHDEEIPAVAPELGDRALRTSLAEEQGGVLLGLVEVRRQDNPCEHVFAIGGLHPALLDGGLCQLIEDVLVLEGQLGNGRLLRLLEVGCDDVKISRCRETVTFHQQLLTIVHQTYGAKVCPVIGELLQFSLPIDGVKVLCSVPDTNEIYHGILIIAPNEGIDIGVESLCQVFLLTCG